MSDAKKPRKQRKSKAPLQIADLELNKETVADLTEGEAEHVKGGMLVFSRMGTKCSDKRVCCW
jgi:hypothetical protein